MKQKLFFFCFALLCSANILALDFYAGGIYYNLIGGDAVAVIKNPSSSSYSNNKYSGAVTIPETVNYNSHTYRVTSIGDWAFENSRSLTSITIPNSVTTIGDRAFSGCYSLTSITIPNSVTTIGDEAFAYCSSLTSITIPNSVNTIGGDAFYNCSSLQYNTYDNAKYLGNTSNPYHALISSINDNSIIDNITSCTIHSNTKTIADEAFRNRQKLTSITIPNSVNTIGSMAFYGCNSLTAVTIGNSVTTIGGYAFRHCSSLTSITIPNSVTTIGGYAFEYCSSLTSITIPNSVTTIGGSAFAYCSSLTSITIPNSVTTIGSEAFDKCSSLQYNTYDNAKFLGNTSNPYHALISSANDNITSCTIHSNTKTIADEAFRSCTSLPSITIPNSVNTISKSAFSDCTSLSSISIPNSVTTIGDYAFSDCTSLSSISIPNSVTTIGNSAFHDCTNLSSISIPNSVTTIGNSAFYDCTSLSSISIPNSVTTIGNYAFSRCTGLNSISIPNSVTTIGDYAFYDCTGLSSISIPNSVTTIGDWAFHSDSNLTSVTIHANISVFGSKIFFNCPKLTEIIWNVNNYSNFSATNNIFYSKNDNYDLRPQITTLIIGDNVETYPNFDFSELTSIIWKAKRCSSVPFNNIRQQITNFTFGDSVAYIPANLCKGMTAIESIKIPNSVTTLGESAFENCIKVRTLHIGDGLTEFPIKAFAGCTGLINLTIRAEMPPYLQANTFESVSRTLLVHVPCTSVKFYQAAYFWNEFVNYQEDFLLDFSTRPADPTMGSTLIMRHPTCEDNTGEIKALPNNGYIFKAWNDGNTDALRTVTVTDDVEYMAYFEKGITEVSVTTTASSATFVWPVVAGAASYELIIWASATKTENFCTLTFNETGTLTGIDFSRSKPAQAEEEEPVAGLTFTVTGLASGTTYAYTLNSYNAEGGILDTQEGQFTTSGSATSEVKNVMIEKESVRKVFEHSTLYILKPNGEKYTIDGRKVEKL